jgi:multimeric flavodoxin WrbA
MQMENQKRILVIMGSPRKGWGQNIQDDLENDLKGLDVEFISLREMNIKQCLGCQTCYSRGDKACPHKDDLQQVFAKMLDSDGVVFVTPVYVLGMTGLMKNFIDRLSFVCHRPQFFKKQALLISYAAVFGNAQTLEGLKWATSMWEFNIVDKVGLLHRGEEMNDQHKKMLHDAARRFKLAVRSEKEKSPSLMSLAAFQLRKEGFLKPAKGVEYEHEFWKKKGWLKADFYYDVTINPFKMLLAKMMARTMKMF